MFPCVLCALTAKIPRRAKFAKVFYELSRQRNHSQDQSPEVDKLAREIIGALIEVHRKLGPGFLENVYEEAACIEFEKRKIPYKTCCPDSINLAIYPKLLSTPSLHGSQKSKGGSWQPDLSWPLGGSSTY
jgi:hypothetical protein